MARGGSTAKSLRQYLLVARKPDKFYDTAAFLNALARNLQKPKTISLGAAISAKDKVTVMPKDFVNLEATAQVVLVRGPHSTPVTDW